MHEGKVDALVMGMSVFYMKGLEGHGFTGCFRLGCGQFR